MSEIAELIEKVSKASGPDREIDRDIHEALTGECVHRRTRTEYCWDQIVVCIDCGVEHPKYQWPFYTASVDAVIALVEKELPGWEINFTAKDGIALDVYLIGPKYRDDRPGEESSPPVGGKPIALALLLAFLRAKQSQEMEN